MSEIDNEKAGISLRVIDEDITHIPRTNIIVASINASGDIQGGVQRAIQQEANAYFTRSIQERIQQDQVVAGDVVFVDGTYQQEQRNFRHVIWIIDEIKNPKSNKLPRANATWY